MAENNELRELRRRRLRELLKELGRGGRSKLANAIDSEANYISQLASHNQAKAFGEDIARRLERAAGKPKYWLDSEQQADWQERSEEWPFGFDRSLWDNLPQARKMEIEANLHATLLGMTAIEAATKQQKRRQG